VTVACVRLSRALVASSKIRAHERALKQAAIQREQLAREVQAEVRKHLAAAKREAA
jgi:hypothetical protein